MTFVSGINSIGSMNAGGVNGINLPPAVNETQAAGSEALSSGTETSFKDLLLDSIKQVNTMQQDADRAVETLYSGGDVNPTEVLTAVQKADLAFRMMMQIRNKLVAAYEDIQNIRI